MPKPYIELNARPLFTRFSLIIFIVIELRAWRRIHRRVRRAFRIAVLLKITPIVFLLSLLGAAVLTLIVWLLVCHVIRPLVLRWRSPKTDDSVGLFHVNPQETVLDSSPAQRRTEWGWRAGTLVRTSERLCFFPENWDTEPLSLRFSQGVFAELVPASWVPLSLVRNWPSRLVLHTKYEEPATFAVPDPDAVLAWFPQEKPDPTPSSIVCDFS